MNGPEGFLPKNQNFMTQVARILWYRPKKVATINKTLVVFFKDVVATLDAQKNLKSIQFMCCVDIETLKLLLEELLTW